MKLQFCLQEKTKQSVPFQFQKQDQIDLQTKHNLADHISQHA